ncbi:MAG: copper-binding protein [bacterium]|nr:copper-binding protein [bacterium]
MSASRPASEKPSKYARLLFLVLAVAALASLAGCGGGEPEKPADRYKVRGVVSQLPVPERSNRELFVHHEEVPGFKNIDGEVVGMDSMTMGFPLADTELPDGLAVGDKIEMEFEVRWSGGDPLAITALEKLPAETRLSFEADEEEGGGDDD